MAGMTKEITEKQRESLPRWTQQYILTLEIELNALRKSMEERRETKTCWGFENAAKHGMAHGFIPDDECVRFNFDDQKLTWIEVRRTTRNRLKVYGSRALIVAMPSGNSMLLQVDNDYKYTIE